MKAIVLDGEMKVHRYGPGKYDIDNSPYCPGNQIVSIHWRLIDTDTGYIGEAERAIFHHNDYPTPDQPDNLNAALGWADVVVAHNAKFDVSYLLESGFKLPTKIWCTMIGEYVLARGTQQKLSLHETALRRGTTPKRGDLVDEMFAQGMGFEEMPLPIVIEYADTDVLSCAEIFLQQFGEFEALKQQGRPLLNVVELMNDMTWFLVEIERNGLKINTTELQRVKLELQTEQAQLIKDLNDIVAEVMGDTPINLNSGVDMTKVVYSREVIDRNLHQKVFNIGLDEDGRERYPPRMSDNQFANAVRTTTRVVKRTRAYNCPVCHGHGQIRRIRKDGTPFAKPNKCKECGGSGYVLQDTGVVAGLKLTPEGPRDASINGFKTGHDEFARLIAQAKERGLLQAELFLTKKQRLNAVNTYLSSFVGGIERWTRHDSILHATFNQCVARTGRLSSTDPNFQNQPKGRKFPIRRVVVSRWQEQGGCILEADFSQLEFAVAGELSRDPQICEDFTNKKDVHRQTASICLEKPKEDITKDERNDHKPYTFAPLYGGQGANEAPHIQQYFKEFFVIYKGHEAWQYDQMDQVVQNGYISVPSGREYMFPGTRRIRGRRTTNATNIVNYPVQGFATGDIVPLACVRVLRRFRELGLSSLPILTVHDSIVIDVYPGELEAVKPVLRWAMTEIHEEIKERWQYEMCLRLRMEMAVGPNWGDMEEIKE